ncbi:hypothetical protein SLE2022_328340 [Rubroshorea leprosula]|uniref:Gibberellin-regulated protein 9 n=1 Tax=Rubroshorea leprosula TaxID=152421 RepID=A0AAV5J6I1_9ROSI|nr:hypothetical protein SLEP1_g20606 [Rubroshorea leprosula]
MKLALVFVIAIFLLQAVVQASALSNAENSLASRDVESNAIAIHGKHPKKINCKFACARRCRKSSRKNVCHRACKTCCNRCHCVPPGTYGHHSACPCYASLKTHGNKLKCP